MISKRNNYAMQAEDARLRFLTYDQTAMPVEQDADFLYLCFCGSDYRIARRDGHMFRKCADRWLPADSHGEVLTIFDYLCDARPGRCPSGEFATIIALGSHIHDRLGNEITPLDRAIDAQPERFCAACIALGGVPASGGDIGFRLKLFPDLPVHLRFWYRDEDFPPKLDILWDKNALHFLRYETLWYADGVLRRQLSAHMGL